MEKIAQAVNKLVEAALDINATEMLIQIASTLLLFIVIRVFFWKKITAFIEARQQFLEDEVNLTTKAHEEALELKSIRDNELNEVRVSAKGIVEEAKDRGEQERIDIVSKAKKEADTILENSRKEVESEIEKARAKINDEIVSVAVLMAEKVVKKEIDAKKHKEIFEDVLKEVSN